MKYAVAAAAFATLAAAQLEELLPEIPGCNYIGCLTTGISETSCGVDVECICGQFDDIAATVVPCLREAECEASDINSLTETLQGYCNMLGSESASVTLPITVTASTATSAETETLPVASDEVSSVLTTTIITGTVTTSSPVASETETVTQTSVESSAEASASAEPSAEPSGDDNGDDGSAGSRAQVAGLGLVIAVAAAVAM